MATIEPFPVLDRQTVFGRGGFGELYPDPRDPTKCIKKLKQPLVGDEASGIVRLVDVVRWASPSDAHILTTRFAWPIEVFGSADGIVGFTMPRAPSSTRFTLSAGRRSQETDLQAKFLMDAAYWNSPVVNTPKPLTGIEHRIEILIDLAVAVQVLHRNGLTYGDISSNNVAIRADDVTGVFLFDADSIMGVAERTRNPIVSPGWEVPVEGDPVGIDRARYALFALRLFLESPNALPNDGEIWAAEQLVGPDATRLIRTTYETGAEAPYLELLEALRRRRTTKRGAQAFAAAVDSGYARWVIREAVHASTPSDRRVLDLAASQLAFETTIRGLAGSRRRQAVKRSNLQRTGFVLDVPPVLSLPNPPQTEADLEDLVYRAMFEEIASHLVSEGLGPLERHGWLGRAVQRALIEGRDPELHLREETGRLTVRAWWPVDPFVNVMNLDIVVNGSAHSAELRRGDADRQMVREVNLPEGGEVEVRLVPGSISPTGHLIWSARSLTEHRRIAPVPPPPRLAKVTARVAPPVVSAVVDPELVRQQQILTQQRAEEERRQQRNRRVRRISLTVIVLALVGVGAARWLLGGFERDEVEFAGYLDRGPDIPAVETASGVTVVSGTIRPRLEISPAGITATWDPILAPSGVSPDHHIVVLSGNGPGRAPSGRFGPYGWAWLRGVPSGSYELRIAPVFGESVRWEGPIDTPRFEIPPAFIDAPTSGLGTGSHIAVEAGAVSVVVRPTASIASSPENVDYIVRWKRQGDVRNAGTVLEQPGVLEIGVLGPGTWELSVQVRVGGSILPEVPLPTLVFPPDQS